METRYCIEYINPQHPLRDDGSLNVRYDRVLTLEQAEHDLTLILSFGGKILDLYMGNVVDGETGEWSPKPMIIDDDDWFTTKWLNTLEVKEVQVEPITEELEEASKEWLRPQLDKSYAAYGETKQMELTHFDGYAMLDAIEFGAKWGKNQAMAEIQAQSMALAHGCLEESESEDLREACEQLVENARKHKAETSNPFFCQTDYKQGVIDGAKWQKQQDQSTIELAEGHAMLAGMEKMKEEMVSKAIDGIARPDDNEIWCNLTSSNLKDGDKVKVIVIKDE